MRRGDVVIAAPGGPFGRKPRPWVVIQSDAFATSLVVLVGVTGTDSEDRPSFRPRLQPTAANGLREMSDVMVDAPLAARRDRITQRIGRLSSDEMLQIELILVQLLGLADPV